MTAIQKPLPLGRTVATPGALAALYAAGENGLAYLRRHASGDWGDVPEEDAEENERALQRGYRILSAYQLQDGTKLWVITEADRSSTCILLPEEY
jgi:hypothetical protein